MDKNAPLISVVILNYNGSGILEDCLDSVMKSDYPDFEVVLVDNASVDDSLEWAQNKFRTDARLRIIRNDRNLLFAGGNNTGIRNARGDLIVILNSDTQVERYWLKEIACMMQDEAIGAAQPKVLIYATSPVKIDYAGGGLDRFGFSRGIASQQVDHGQFDDGRDIFYAAGTAMVLKKRVLDEVGLFDEKFGMHWEDTDLSWRIRLRGYRIILIPKAIVYHKGSRTMHKFAKKEDVSWYLRRNRIFGLIKNYGAWNLIRFLPVTVLFYFMLFLKELFINWDLKLALSSIRAISWNIKELPNALRERKIIQKFIRRIPDKQITRFMEQKSIAFEYLCGKLWL